TQATRGRNSTRPSQKSCPASKPKSSGDPIRSKDLQCCPNAGSSSVPSHGSIAVEDSPRIGRISIAKASHSCTSPQFGSCSENSAIQPKVSGQTLRPKVETLTVATRRLREWELRVTNGGSPM